MLKILKKILFNFLWNNKPHKIAKTVTTKPGADWGLAIIDIENKTYGTQDNLNKTYNEWDR